MEWNRVNRWLSRDESDGMSVMESSGVESNRWEWNGIEWRE